MARKPRADDDEDANICLGIGCIGELRDGAARGRRLSHPIGFVHFPDKPERKARARAKPAKPKPKPKRRMR